MTVRPGGAPPAGTSAGSVLAPAVRTLQRVRAVSPDAADRAERALRATLQPVIESRWPEVTTTFSTLTNTGFPVEFAWTSRDASVRWTAEVAAPERANRDRLGLALQRAGMDREHTAAVWSAAQARGPLQYGAWLGSRYTATTELAKVYLELPAGLPAAMTARHPVLALPGLRWRMAGLNADGTYEVYARSDVVDRRLVDRLEEQTVGSTGLLCSAVAELVGASGLPKRAGLSVLLTPDGRTLALTWFTSALGSFRDDAAAREFVDNLMTGSNAPGSLETYRALASGPSDGRWRHTLLGVGLGADGRAWLQAGLRPT